MLRQRGVFSTPLRGAQFKFAAAAPGLQNPRSGFGASRKEVSVTRAPLAGRGGAGDHAHVARVARLRPPQKDCLLEVRRP